MLPRKFIHVGEIFVGIKPTEIVTVLGSCVSVCLYDKVELIGGMNHYLLALWNGNGLESPKYGNVAIPKLIENMENIGCLRRNMEAKIFGGANIHRTNSEGQLIGQKNVLIAKEILRHYSIPIRAEDTGGNNGRRIMMISDANRIILKYVQNEIME
ncbi:MULTISPECIES: chemotaxis protein CheD [Sulfurospirillum]|uniref:Probable chemoreceptor glutamine deamidase CheD n=3 Tax=Sulfurospirillum TaxID=57665 RepID=A0A1D7TML2_9BACT|nr:MULTISPECIES: chemotaxis protein CheD [Sulfurospirillum]AHJ13972.1 chemoreceptor glutamine deamidase CheD [Sulfurospirillum multivorans DSM 12446]AOO66223.1 chemoreceptor glutamine deamidase CheD [Sulfurospirillum halorespirans DSM 13726]QEH07460.1 chemoreceptor glutamine deamidase CheD [Sulfurospirillum multivorans]